MTNNPYTLETYIAELTRNMQFECQIEDAERVLDEAESATSYRGRIQDSNLVVTNMKRKHISDSGSFANKESERETELMIDDDSSKRMKIMPALLLDGLKDVMSEMAEEKNLSEAALYRGRIEDSKLVVMDKKRKHSSEYGANRESEGVMDLMIENDSCKRMKNMPPLLPDEFKDVLSKLAEGKNLSETKLLFQKTLVSTDCGLGQNRPAITINCWNVFTDGGITAIRGYCENYDHKNCLLVNIVEPNLDVGVVHMSTLFKENECDYMTHILNDSSWDRIVKQHELKEGMVVQLWGFKIDSKLWFALVKLP